jgi:hypothetical protein
MLAPRPGQLRHVGVHHRRQHLPARTDREASRPSLADSTIFPNEINTSDGTTATGVRLLSTALLW